MSSFKKGVFGRDQFVRDPLDGVESLGRAHPVGGDVAGLALDLLFDPGDANLEKLVEVRAEDGQEFDALDQRLGGVLRFFQDAPVEFEPAQLAVNEIFRGGKTGSRSAFGSLSARKRDDIRRLFRRRRFRFRIHRSQAGAANRQIRLL
jgi:hypothetical protein